MNAVDQTRFGEGGDCLAACIASILGLPLDGMPDTGKKGYSTDLAAFLNPLGYAYVEMWRGNLRRLKQDDPPLEEMSLGWQPLIGGSSRPLCVLCGPSPRNPLWNHATVGRTNGWNYEVLHDPHPDRSGLLEVTHIGFLVRLDGK